jgi:hypothetical protein
MEPGASLSEERLCEIAGINRSTRHNWAKRGLLELAQDYREADAVEAAVLARLFSILGTSDAPVAWVQIRSVLPDFWDVGGLDLLFDTQHKEALLASEGGAFERERFRHSRPLRVVFLSDTIRDIRIAFTRVVSLGT